MNLLKWLKHSFENRGKASARKLTVFAAFFLLNIGFIVHLYTNNTIQIEYIIVYSVIVLLGLGFLTAENLVEMIKGKFDNSGSYFNYNTPIFTRRNKVDNPDEEI